MNRRDMSHLLAKLRCRAKRCVRCCSIQGGEGGGANEEVSLFMLQKHTTLTVGSFYSEPITFFVVRQGRPYTNFSGSTGFILVCRTWPRLRQGGVTFEAFLQWLGLPCSLPARVIPCSFCDLELSCCSKFAIESAVEWEATLRQKNPLPNLLSSP